MVYTTYKHGDLGDGKHDIVLPTFVKDYLSCSKGFTVRCGVVWDHRAPRFSLGSGPGSPGALPNSRTTGRRGHLTSLQGLRIHCWVLGRTIESVDSSSTKVALFFMPFSEDVRHPAMTRFRMFLLLMVFGILASLARRPVSAMAEHGSCISNRTLFTYLNRVNESSWNETCGAWYFVYFMFHVFSHVSTDIGHWLHLRGCSVRHGSHRKFWFLCYHGS